MSARKPEEIFVERLEELLRGREAKLVAERSGIAQTTISKWKHGRIPANPSLDTLVRLARALGVPLVYLISDGVYEPAYDAAAVERLMRATEELLRAATVARHAVTDAMKKP